MFALTGEVLFEQGFSDFRSRTNGAADNLSPSRWLLEFWATAVFRLDLKTKGNAIVYVRLFWVKLDLVGKTAQFELIEFTKNVFVLKI